MQNIEEGYKLWRMTWPEIQGALEDMDGIIIPVGSMEQHGPHIPIDNDSFSSITIAERAVWQARKQNIKILIAPPILYGISWYHKEFPGTITISHQLYINFIIEYCECLIKGGFKNLLLFNAHGGNANALNIAVDIIYDHCRTKVYLGRWLELAAEEIKAFRTPLIHAEEVETSVALALNQRVDMRMATVDCFDRKKAIEERLHEKTSTIVKYDNHHIGSFVGCPMDRIVDISESGIIGDARKANIEKGEKVVKRIVDNIVTFFGELKL